MISEYKYLFLICIKNKYTTKIILSDYSDEGKNSNCHNLVGAGELAEKLQRHKRSLCLRSIFFFNCEVDFVRQQRKEYAEATHN